MIYNINTLVEGFEKFSRNAKKKHNAFCLEQYVYSKIK